MFGPFFKTLFLAWGYKQHRQGAACPWPGRLSVQTGTRPRIASEALAVTARTKCSHQTKSLGRRDGGLQSFFPRALVSRSLMAQMSRWMPQQPSEGSGLGDMLLVGTSTLRSRRSWN